MNASGEHNFEPIPPGDQASYRIDPRRYYASAAARQQGIAAVGALVAEVEALRPQVATDPGMLLQALQKNAALRPTLDRLWIHARVVASQNTDDTTILDEYNQLEADVDARTAFLEATVRDLPDTILKAFLHTEPALASYRSAFDAWRRTIPHRLPEPEEILLSELENTTRRWSLDLYTQTLKTAPFGTIKLNGEEVPVRQQFDKLMHQPDRAIRQEAYRRLGYGYRDQGESFASNLLRVGRAADSAAKRRHFNDALEGSYFNLYLSPAHVDAVLGAFEAHREVARRFQRANSAYVAKQLGLSAAEPYDLDAPLPGVTTPRLTIAEASDAVRVATSVFGPDYRAQLDSILDPKNGRLDIVAGPKRAPGAFTLGPYGGEAVFFMESYEGYVADVVSLAHELAHAVHFGLMSAAKVSWYSSSGPAYLLEGTAKVNELLVLDELAHHATTEAERIFYLRELGSKLASVRFTTMYWAVLATRFEVDVNRGLAGGTVTAPAAVHQTWLRVGNELSEAYDGVPDNAYIWANTPNFFKWPRTYVNYLYAWVIAASIYERVYSDPTVAAKLVDLMRSGFSQEPAKLLEHHLGIDLTNPATLEGAFALLDNRVREFEESVGGSSPF